MLRSRIHIHVFWSYIIKFDYHKDYPGEQEKEHLYVVHATIACDSDT